MSSFTSGLILGVILSAIILTLYFWHREVENLKYFRHEILRESIHSERLRDALRVALNADTKEWERSSKMYEELIKDKERHHG